MCDTVFSHKTSHTSPRKIKEIMDEMICRGRCVTDHTWSYGFLFETAYDCGCAAIDLVGQLAPMKEDSPSAQLIIKRIKAIDIAQEALLHCGADIPKGV